MKPSVSSIGIVVPAFQPPPEQLETLILRIVHSCRNSSCRVVFVDDGSEPRLVLPTGVPPFFQLIRHNRNLGKGMALKTGFTYLMENYSPQVIITMDADLQHPPEYIPEFVKAYQLGKGEVVIGYRRRNPLYMPLPRILSNTLTSLIISCLTGQLVRDSQCGFRLIASDVLSNLILEEKRFHLESEMLIKAGWNRFTIASIPIPTIYSTEKSSINHWRDSLNFVNLIFKILKDRIKNSCMSASET